MKTEYKWFFLPEYEKEEEYLNQKAKEGLELVDIQTRIFTVAYKFKETDPKNMIYSLDFHTEDDEVSYIQMYEDYGWKFIKKYNNFYYFKKEGNQEDLEIFSDDESRYEMIENIKNKQLRVIIYLFCFSTLLFIFLFDRMGYFAIVYLAFLILDLYFVLRCIKGFKVLEKKYKVK